MCKNYIETQSYQSVESLLKVNGFAYVVQGDRTLDNTNVPLIFKQRFTDIYSQNNIVKRGLKFKTMVAMTHCHQK